jgi:hypothetical protein
MEMFADWGARCRYPKPKQCSGRHPSRGIDAASTRARHGSSGPAAQGAGATAAFDSLYCISFTEQGLLADRAQMATAVNAAHEILLRCDPAEIAGYIRARKVRSLLQVIERLSAGLRDQLIKLKPKFGLPGGFSIELG